MSEKRKNAPGAGRPPAQDRREPLNVRVPASLLERLNRRAQETGEGRGRIVERALDERLPK